MYYIYLIELILVGLVITIIPNFLIYIMVREYDKIVYIEGYKQKKRPDILLARIVYTALSLVFMALSFVALIFFIVSKKVERKKLLVTFANMLVTPIIGIALPIAWLIFCKNVAINHDLYAIANLLDYIRFMHMCVSIPFYLILAVKQMMKLTSIETKMLYEYVNTTDKYDSKASKRSLWPAVRLEEEFAQDYLIFYKDVGQWKRDSFNIINYGVYYKLLVVFSSWVILFTNILMSTVYFDVLDKPYPISATDYHPMTSIFWGDLYIFFYTYFTPITLLLILIPLLLMYILNYQSMLLRKVSTIIGRKKVELDEDRVQACKPFGLFGNYKLTKIVKLVIIGITFVYLITVCRDLYPIDYNDFYTHESHYLRPYGALGLDEISFAKNKEEVVDGVVNRNNYKEYASDEKYGYIMKHPRQIVDDLDELGFIDEESSTQNSYVFRPVDDDEFYMRIPFDEEARKLYPKYKYNIYIYINYYSFGIHFNNFNAPSYDTNLYINDDYFPKIANNYSTEESALYDEMFKTVSDLIDKLFAMEMEDQGIEI